ncbi:hypothetical protein NKH77_20165 [Streptomyces sp. M19]
MRHPRLRGAAGHRRRLGPSGQRLYAAVPAPGCPPRGAAKTPKAPPQTAPPATRDPGGHAAAGHASAGAARGHRSLAEGGAGWLVPPHAAYADATDPAELRAALGQAARTIEAVDRCR